MASPLLPYPQHIFLPVTRQDNHVKWHGNGKGALVITWDPKDMARLKTLEKAVKVPPHGMSNDELARLGMLNLPLILLVSHWWTGFVMMNMGENAFLRKKGDPTDGSKDFSVAFVPPEYVAFLVSCMLCSFNCQRTDHQGGNYRRI